MATWVCGGSATLPSNRASACSPSSAIASPPSNSKPFDPTSIAFFLHTRFPKLAMTRTPLHSGSASPLNCTQTETVNIPNGNQGFDPHEFDPKLVQELVYEALVWCSLHGLVVGDRAIQRSGTAPGVGMVHAPISLLPVSFPEAQWNQACELAPVFNELMDRVSLDDQFLQDSLSRTRKVDSFTSRLLDIHSKMMEINKKEDIRLGLHRSDYMLDAQTKSLLQIEFNTVSSSFSGLSCRVTDLHRNLVEHHGSHLGLDFNRIPENSAVNQFAAAIAKAWSEYNNPRAVVMIVVQPEERNMYDQHWLSFVLKEKHGVSSIRRTLTQINTEAELLANGLLSVSGKEVAVVYFRAGYTPSDYPSEAEWDARLLMEQSSAIKCPTISYHLAGSKKIQQELAKPNVLERFLDSEHEVSLIRKCFAGLWSLDDSSVVSDAIEKPDLYVMKPQREGGGNNIYGDDVKEALLRIRKDGSDEDAAYILMQRIFPTVSPALLVRNGICHKDHAISELGVYGTYLRNKDKVIVNQQSGYLMRTKVASSNEGGVAAGYAVLDSMYLT